MVLLKRIKKSEIAIIEEQRILAFILITLLFCQSLIPSPATGSDKIHK